MLSSKVRELEPNSTQTILRSLTIDTTHLAKENENNACDEVQIPAHFRPKAKKIIQQLLASNYYTLTQSTADIFTWSSKVKPFSITFSSPHPSLVKLDNKAVALNEIITNIDAQGNIKYQVKAFDGSLHYIDINQIPNGAVQQNHLTIVVPHLHALEEEEHSNNSKVTLRPPRKSF